MQNLLRLLVLALLLCSGLLAQEGVAHPLVGTWRSEDGAHVLALGADGKASVDGRETTWRRFGRAKLRVKLPGGVERAVYELDRNTLTVHWKNGAQRYVRVRSLLPEVPPALAGVGKGPTTAWTHPKDYFSFALPARWEVLEVAESMLLVNPGLTEEDDLEAFVFVGWGSLEDDDKGLSPVQLMARSEKEWLAQLAEDGLFLDKAKKAPRRVLVGDVPGAEQEWTGRAQNGQGLRVWGGGIVKRDAFLYLAVVAQNEKAKEYFPLAKQLFLSVVPTPPERNVALEKLLAGHRIERTNHSEGGATGSKYTFHPGGKVESFWFMSGSYGLGSVSTSDTEWGGYEIFGNEIYIYMKSGQIDGTVVTDEAGAPVALVVEGSRYSL